MLKLFIKYVLIYLHALCVDNIIWLCIAQLVSDFIVWSLSIWHFFGDFCKKNVFFKNNFSVLDILYYSVIITFSEMEYNVVL